MKFTNTFLVLIALLLGVIASRLWSTGISIQNVYESNQLLINACQSLLGSNQRLEGEIALLRQQIGEFGEKVLKR
jgi:hypothetical protein